MLNLRKKKLWAPGAPFLYDLKFTLYRGKEKVDEVQSYFGLRKVAIEGRRILINDKPVFQRLILDQGFYPDGNLDRSDRRGPEARHRDVDGRRLQRRAVASESV